MSDSDRGELIDRVLVQLSEDLCVGGNPLLDDEQARSQMEAHVRAILEAALSRLEGNLSVPRVTTAAEVSEIGRIRESQGISPTQSLRASSSLFTRALPLLTAYCTDQGFRCGSEEVALVLNTTIFRFVEAAAQSYADGILDKMVAIQHEERLSIARDLHDRVAHGIMAGILRNDLAEDEADPLRAHELRRTGHELLSHALEDTQDIATGLRHAVTRGSIQGTVEDFIERAFRDEPIEVRLQGCGRPIVLPEIVEEHVFLIVREAIRNAREHAHCAVLTVAFDWREDGLVVDIDDDGIGFATSEGHPQGMGLIGMQERADLIAADLSITSAPEAGTRIHLEVPHDRT